MNALTAARAARPRRVERQVLARDREIANPFTKDLQVAAHARRPPLPAATG